MNSTRHQSVSVLAVLNLIILLVMIPLSGAFAQTGSTEATASSSEDAVASVTDEVVTTDPVALGYQVERVPGGNEVIGDFVVGPGKIDVEIEPGKTKIVEISATNRTGVDRIFNFSAEDTTGSADGSQEIILLGNDKGPYSLKDYLLVPKGGILIKHNERVRIPVKVSIPADAEPGGLYGSVLVQTVTEGSSGDASTNSTVRSPLITRIGTLFFVTVAGDIERDGKTIAFSTAGEKKFFNSSPIPFNLVYENQGSIHTTPYGELEITNTAGESVGFLELEPWFVMPNSLRNREITWNRELLVGKYKATVRINRGYDNLVDEFSAEFWVIPWKLAAAVFAGFFIFFFIVRFFFTRFEFKRKT